MAKDIRKTITKCEVVFSNGHDVLISGKLLWLFRANGEFVKRILPIRRPYKAIFLPNRTALVEGCADGAYYYLNLETGDILWVTKKTFRRSTEVSRFVLSPDGTTVYNLFYATPKDKEFLYVERIIPQTHTHDIFPVNVSFGPANGGLCLTADLFCDSEGTLCALQYRNITRYGDYEYWETPRVIYEYGILALPICENALQPYWKKYWKAERLDYKTTIRGCDGTHILYEDLTVLNLETNTVFSLISPDDRKSFSPYSFDYFYDPERYLLTIFRYDWLNLVIDCKNRKIVGRYRTEENEDCVGYHGWLIGNEFWMGSKNGVVSYPFPNV